MEVYWRAPDRSKQVILGWRDGAFLPTDINYHRDHLGIVTNNFGDVIRIGEGDEVRDVVHPLSPARPGGVRLCARRLAAIRTGGGEITVREVQVRPRSFARPLVVGTLYLDVATAQLVRFRFSFTPAAYLDRQLEDISIVLENALFEHRYWLPYRQEVEIRRRTSWLDFPARGIIRGRWEIDDYDLNVGIPPAVLAGPAIGGLARPRPDDSTWGGPLTAAIAGVAAPVNRQDMDALRVEVERIAGVAGAGRAALQRLAAGSVSDVVRVNRVQGLALGFGGVIGLRAAGSSSAPSSGTAPRTTGSPAGSRCSAGTGRHPGLARRRAGDRDLQRPARDRAGAQLPAEPGGRRRLRRLRPAPARRRWRAAAAERADHALARAGCRGEPVGGRRGLARQRQLPAEPAARRGNLSGRARGGWSGRAAASRSDRDLQGRLGLEAGEGRGEYVRVTAEGRWLRTAGPGQLLSRVYLGAGTDGLPPYRSFVLGGRGTLVGEPFRAYGGRSAVLGHLEWRFEVPVPAIALGSFAVTGRRMTVAPFLAAGWPAGRCRACPGRTPTASGRSAGVALEMVHAADPGRGRRGPAGRADRASRWT